MNQIGNRQAGSLLPRPAALALALAALLAGLACSAVSSLPFLTGTATPAPTATAAARPGEQPLQIEGGPTINTRRDTRLAVTERVPVLEALAEEEYSTEALAEVGQTFTFTVDLPGNLPVLWVYGWCSATPVILEQNLAVMRLEFSANDTPVDAQQFEPFDQQNDEAACRYFAAEVFDWPSGTSTLQTKVIFTEPLDDGFAEYDAGEQLFVYTVTAP